jgi:N-acetylglucosamine kinase-like BadF-type ATPase
MTRTLRLLAGMDVGGSKSECVICTEEGAIRAWQVAESDSLHSAGNISRLCRLISDTCARAGADAADLEAIVIGMSGADSPGAAERARQSVLSELPVRNVVVANDAAAALLAATTQRPAAVLIVGTGSIAYGEDAGRSYRVGGWGPLTGDEGSGLEIARQACAAVLLAEDGRAPDTALTDEALRFFGLGEPAELVELTGHFCCEPRRLASFTPSVLACARSGDPVAQRITGEAAAALARLGAALVAQLERDDHAIPFALAGGVIQGNSSFAQMVRDELTDMTLPVELTSPSMPPVLGAVLSAARVTAGPDAAGRVREGLAGELARGSRPSPISSGGAS